MTISQRIIELFHIYKTKQNISQKDFCDATGINQKNISNVVKGKTKIPRGDILSAILKFDNKVNPYWILGIVDEPMFLEGVEKRDIEIVEIANTVNKPKITDEMMMSLFKELTEKVEELSERLDKAGIE